jgi:hypothetical protein
MCALVLLPSDLSATRIPHINNLVAWEAICSTPLPQEQTPSTQSEASSQPQPPHQQGEQKEGDEDGGSVAEEVEGGSSGMDRIHGPLLRTVLCLDQVMHESHQWVPVRACTGIDIY